MKQYIEHDVKIKIDMPIDPSKKNTRLENQQPNQKKEVHILFE